MTVKRLGAALLKHGLKPGDVLSISAPNSIEHVFLFFSISMIGAVYHVGDWESSEGTTIIFSTIWFKHILFSKDYKQHLVSEYVYYMYVYISIYL